MVDLYGNNARYEAAKAKMAAWDIPEQNMRLLVRYLAEQIDHLSPGKKYSDFCLLKRLFFGLTQGKRRPALIAKPLEAMTIKDFERLAARLAAEVPSKETFKKLTQHIKRLYDLAFDESDNRKHQYILRRLTARGRKAFFKWRHTAPINLSVTDGQFYQEREFVRLLRVATRPQERALLAVAWETTARPNEYLSLNCGDVRALPQGFAFPIMVSKSHDGTTHLVTRYVIVFRAEFNEFWRLHPFKDDPNAPLFYRADNRRTTGQRLGPAGANKILKKLDHLSGVRKNGTLYFLRHGGYTWKRTRGMNQAMADREMGWVEGSKQQRRYLHLTDDDVLAERLRFAGERFEQEVKPTLKGKSCPYCNTENSPVDDRCKRCGQTLNIAEITGKLEALLKEKATETETLKRQVGELARQLHAEGTRRARIDRLLDQVLSDDVLTKLATEVKDRGLLDAVREV